MVPWVTASRTDVDNATYDEGDEADDDLEKDAQEPTFPQDFVYDDDLDTGWDCQDDHLGSKTNSPWNEWEYDPNNPTVAVLV